VVCAGARRGLIIASRNVRELRDRHALASTGALSSTRSITAPRRRALVSALATKRLIQRFRDRLDERTCFEPLQYPDR
jgi:hypothetical protein